MYCDNKYRKTTIRLLVAILDFKKRVIKYSTYKTFIL